MTTEATFREFAPEQRVFGRYTLRKILGRGGMGIVWLAHDEELERDVALKFLPDLIALDRTLLSELKRETRRSLELTHKNIVRIHDFVNNERSACISMEYIDGDTLANLRAEKGEKVFQPEEIAGWTAQLCDALDYAHHHARIVHRDLKPANLMVNQRGNLKIADFGIARSLGDSMSKLTMAQGTSGTLVYMSPQQLDGERGTHLDDIYALGATLYDLLTNKPPFYSGNVDRQIHERVAPSITERRKEFDLEPAFIPPVWEATVAACLAKDPAQRPQSTAEVAQRLQLGPATTGITTVPARGANRKVLLGLSIAALALLALAGWYFGILKRPTTPLSDGPPPQAAPLSEKSIAVLPFENLSKDEENAFFAGGVQDQILSNLAKIADLKVISRTSVMPYKNTATRNLREIAQQLGVAHILEGSVQRAANRIRVHAQLIDARTDTHLWAEHYDREVADVFAIQSEIARAIADQLQAKISPGEKAAIAEAPTTDLAANALYAQASEAELTKPEPEGLLEAVRLLDAAVARDPHFLLAFCMLGRLHLMMYWGGYDHTPARRELANAAIQNAVRLQPEAGEVHLALARYAYWGFRDYDRARAELDLARSTLPNNVDVFFLTAVIDRRQGRWTESTRNFERAAALAPRDAYILGNAAETYQVLRRYSDATRLFQQALTFSPGDYNARLEKREQTILFLRIAIALQPFYERADIRPLRAELSAILSEEPGAAEKIAFQLFLCAIAERDSIAANRALAAIPAEGTRAGGNFNYPREWFAGVAARTFNDSTAATAAFTAARALAAKIVDEQPDYPQAWMLLGRIDAALGRKEEAVREGRRACELLPLSKDAAWGARFIRNLAEIYAWTNEKDLALETLATAAQLPGGSTYGELKLDPLWDPLRGDPRFEKIVASLDPKLAR